MALVGLCDKLYATNSDSFITTVLALSCDLKFSSLMFHQAHAVLVRHQHPAACSGYLLLGVCPSLQRFA